MSYSANPTRPLQWALLVALLVLPQGAFRNLDPVPSSVHSVHRPQPSSFATESPRAPEPLPAQTAELSSADNNRPEPTPEPDLPKRYVERPLPTVPLTQKPPGWLLSDSTWKSLDRIPVRFDFDTGQGQSYIGLSIVLPFGG